MFMEKEMQPMFLTGAFLALVMIVLALVTYVNNKGKKLFNGIATESRENMRQYFFAVLEDNDKEQRIKGFADSDLIEVYE